MPSVAAYRKGFGLKKGMTLSIPKGPSFVLKRCEVGHVVIIPYERYEFPTTLALALDPESKVTSKNLVKDAIAAVKAQVEGAKIIPSDFGNPYECHFGDLDGKLIKEKGVEMVEIVCRGWGDRRLDIDGKGNKTAPKVEKTPEEKRAQREETKALKEALPGYRLLTATYANSKCTTCGNNMEIGVRIAKLEDSAGKGGWHHVDCLLEKKGIPKPFVTSTKSEKAPTKKRKRGAEKEAEEEGDGKEQTKTKAKAKTETKPVVTKAAEGKAKKPAKKKAKKE